MPRLREKIFSKEMKNYVWKPAAIYAAGMASIGLIGFVGEPPIYWLPLAYGVIGGGIKGIGGYVELRHDKKHRCADQSKEFTPNLVALLNMNDTE